MSFKLRFKWEEIPQTRSSWCSRKCPVPRTSFWTWLKSLGALNNPLRYWSWQTLDPEQLSLLTHSEGARNALWLSLTCEELRVFGVFQEVTTRIREMPGSLDGLIESILDRLISEDETGMVEKVRQGCVVSVWNRKSVYFIIHFCRDAFQHWLSQLQAWCFTDTTCMHIVWGGGLTWNIKMGREQRSSYLWCKFNIY